MSPPSGRQSTSTVGRPKSGIPDGVDVSGTYQSVTFAAIYGVGWP